jgi:glycosyltransferase involved in cell wall biosynthesis
MQATADVGLVTLLPDAGRTSVPSKVLGYLAAGRAVVGSVATDSPTALAIREGNCGMVVECQDAQSIADAILGYARNRPLHAEHCKNARSYAENVYSRLVVTEVLEKELRSLL